MSCFDYIFTSPSLLEQFSDAKLQESVALTLLSTQLKDLAKEYNLFVSSSTQVNAEAMNGEGFKSETSIRGSKGIIDLTLSRFEKQFSKVSEGELLESRKDKQAETDI